MQILGGLCCTKEHEAGAPGRLTESSVQGVLPAKGNSIYHYAEWPISADKRQESPLRASHGGFFTWIR